MIRIPSQAKMSLCPYYTTHSDSQSPLTHASFQKQTNKQKPPSIGLLHIISGKRSVRSIHIKEGKCDQWSRKKTNNGKNPQMIKVLELANEGFKTIIILKKTRTNRWKDNFNWL